MRIASLSPAATEILFALGAGDQIVATDHYSDEPEAAKALPHLKGHQEIRPPALDEFAPEIVFTGTAVQDKLAAELRADGRYAVIHQDPRTVDEIYAAIRAIGMIVGREKEAAVAILKMQQGFNDVRKKGSLLPRKPKVYCEEWHNPPMAGGNWVPEIVRIAGGEPFPLPPRSLSREVTLEEVSAFAPDMIVLNICGAGRLANKTLLSARPGWDALEAVTSGRLFVIDDSLLNRPGPRLVEGAQRLFGWMFERCR